MDVLHKVAHRHKLKVLFHEKPFKGINGSGKHCNWSLSTNHGENLLDPTVTPEKNDQFIFFLIAILNAVHVHAGLLRLGVASASNDHRLGANEAPPAIISVFLGKHLTEVLDAIEENRKVNYSPPHVERIKVGGTAIDVKISSLPEILRDLTDRNRTSPFAFTGNKFEFRAVGSKQSPSFPVTILNAVVASSIQEIIEALKKQKGNKDSLTDEDKSTVIRHYIKKTKPIRFDGDNYSAEWVEEAKVRGLPNFKNSPEAFPQLLEPIHTKMLMKDGIFSESEIRSRHHILLEKYAKDLLIEAGTFETIVNTQILPAAYEFRKSLAEGINALSSSTSREAATPEINILLRTTPKVDELQRLMDTLKGRIEEISKIENLTEQVARTLTLISLLEAARIQVDELEEIVPNKLWPLPKYSELLFT